MEEIPKAAQDTKTRQQELSRRQILKIMGASGGALAASAFLPNSWLTPMVEIGVLPAHAQATGEITISDLQYTITRTTSQQNPLDRSLSQPCYYDAGAGFSDPTAMLNNTNCLVNMTHQGSSSGLSVNGARVYYQCPYTGTVNWSFAALSSLVGEDVCTQIENEDTGQSSNQLCRELLSCFG